MKSTFLFTTPELDDKLARIQKAIRLSMNGVVADSMKDHGLEYKKNYGVTILRLKEIARDFTPELPLADRLWLLGIRETMILATMLAPASSFPPAKARAWSKDCTNQELIEQGCMNLFQHLPDAVEFALECTKNDESHVQSIGFTVALRQYGALSQEQVKWICSRGLELAGTTDSYLVRTIAACMARLTRIDRETAMYVKHIVSQSTNNQSIGIITICKFVDNELIFLGYE